jgi:hypothetical protein
MATPLAMSKIVRHVSMHVVELAERGARAMLDDSSSATLLRRTRRVRLQGLRNLDGVDDVVEWYAQDHDGAVRAVLLWEWSVLLLWKKEFERRAHGAR